MSNNRSSLPTMTTSLYSSNSSTAVPNISNKTVTNKKQKRSSRNIKNSKKKKPTLPTRAEKRKQLKERTIAHAQIRESVISDAFNQTLEHITHDLKYKIQCEISKYKTSFIDNILLLFHSFVDPWTGSVANGSNWFNKTHAWKITGLLVCCHLYNILLSNAITPEHFMYYCNQIKGITDTHKEYVFHYCCIYFINELKIKILRFKNTKDWPFIPRAATVRYRTLHEIWFIISEGKFNVESEKMYKDNNKNKGKNEKEKYSPIIVNKHGKKWRKLLDQFRSTLDTHNHTILHTSLVKNIRNNSYKDFAPRVLSNRDKTIIYAYGYTLNQNNNNVKENNKGRKRKRNGTLESESDNINTMNKPPRKKCKRLRPTKKVLKKFIRRCVECKQSDDKDAIVKCVKCHNGYHTYCMGEWDPKDKFYCHKCYNDETTCSEDETAISQSYGNRTHKLNRNLKKKKIFIDTRLSDEDNTNNIIKPKQIMLRKNDNCNKINNGNDSITFNLPQLDFETHNINLNNNNSSSDLHSALNTFVQNDANIANKTKDEIVNEFKNILDMHKPIQRTSTPQFPPLPNNNINMTSGFSGLSSTTNSSVPTDINTNSSIVSSEEMCRRDSFANNMLNNFPPPSPFYSIFPMNNDVDSVAGFNEGPFKL